MRDSTRGGHSLTRSSSDPVPLMIAIGEPTITRGPYPQSPPSKDDSLEIVTHVTRPYDTPPRHDSSMSDARRKLTPGCTELMMNKAAFGGDDHMSEPSPVE